MGAVRGASEAYDQTVGSYSAGVNERSNNEVRHMSHSYEIIYHMSVVREDIPKLSTSWKEHVRIAIEKKLTTSPDIFGKPLRQSLRGYRSLRVGEYRVIFKIKGSTVMVLLIEHRSVVYEQVGKRV